MSSLWETLFRAMGEKINDPFFPKDHRHVIFTLPGPLWDIVGSRAEVLIRDMLNAAKTVINRIFEDRFRKTRVRPGMICIVHYSGRDMKYNPHIHMLVTEGGLTSSGQWKQHYYWDYSKMNVYWKYEVLKRFRFHCRDSLEIKSLIDKQQKMRFKDNTNGYVVKNYRGVLDVKNIGSYLARYVRHPPIGESRILTFNGDEIKIKYEWDNKIHDTEISVNQFIAAILANIPSKGFKVVRHYGLYSNLKYRWAFGKISPNRLSSRIVGQQVIYPFTLEVICSNCKGVMEPFQMEYIRRGEWMIVYF
jgi:hypothetical protein